MQIDLSLSRRRFLGTSVAATAVLGFSRVPYLAAQDATPVPLLGWSDDFSDNGLLNVATTVAPISSIVRNIGGNRINLRGIVPDGTNSHTFEPAPSDAVILSNADVLIANGLDLEDPTIEMANENLPEGAAVFTLGDKTITPEQYAYDFSFPEEDGHPNPHLWTNIPYAIAYAELVTEELSRLDPDNADYFAGNLDRYRTALETLDAAVQATVDSIPEENRRLLTYHDSWAYFAPNYGMTVIGAIQPSDFSEPSPRDVADLIDQIREENVPAIFGSEVFPSGVLEQIARETGAEYVDDLRDDEPPGDAGSPEHTFIGMMKRNLQIMAGALGGDPSLMDGVDPADTWVP
ncbi:MAG: zinc ABC transporter substrate-binding protein [Thermomicrobiales bacterium]|nr:zinc ABC transporter substrate-binding protein [Thermomicrobiales bacterium]MCO5220885.1 metal ABC transporter substrate-binding protein [Thermomicrobiales bacterium]